MSRMRNKAKTPPIMKVRPSMKFRYGDDDYGQELYVPTLEEIKKAYGPAMTLAGPQSVREEMVMAMDAALEAHGGYTMLQHAFEMGMMQFGAGQFMGYAGLSNLAQDGLVSACINTVADDMTREWITISKKNKGNTPDAEEREKVERLEAAAKKYKMREAFHDAARLTQLFGGCLMYIDTGIPHDDSLMEPLTVSSVAAELRKGAFHGFTVVEPINCFPGIYNSMDPLLDNYFVPQSWLALSKRIHSSRIIHIHSCLPPILLRPSYNFFGVPHAQILYDYVLHFQECRISAQRLLSRFSRTVLKTDMQTIMQGGPTDDLDRRVKYMVDRQHNEGVTVIDKENEEISNVTTPISGVSEIVQQSLEYVSAINRTPVVKLLGLSPSGFNATGESDTRNYYDHILSQCELILRKGIKKGLDVLQIVEFGKIDPDIDFEFNHLWTMDEAQQADIDSKHTADVLSVYESQLISGKSAVDELKARNVFKSDVQAEEEALDAESGGKGEIQWGKLVPGTKGNEDGANTATA